MIFNWEYYINKNKDLLHSGIKSRELAYEHFKNFGMKEKRIYVDISIFFNWMEYISNHKDLKHIPNEEEAWRHYIYHGKKENRTVREKEYLKKYCL